jgi:outer membrane lipoprotein-sorting protein
MPRKPEPMRRPTSTALLTAGLIACLSGAVLAQGGPIQLTPGGAPPQTPAAPGAVQQAQAQRTPAAPPSQTTRGNLTPAQVATLRRITEVFNSVREMNGRFTQVEADGSRTTGRFYITKPGRIRFQYDRPSVLDIVSDGTDVVVRDRRLNTQDLYPLRDTPLRYLTNERIDLLRDARVVSVFNDQDMVSVTIEERGTFTEGQLTLYFDASNFSLRQWTITDARGNETAVTVAGVTTNQRNNPQLFAIDRSPQVGPRDRNNN